MLASNITSDPVETQMFIYIKYIALLFLLHHLWYVVDPWCNRRPSLCSLNDQAPCVVLYSIVQYCTVLYSTILNCTVQYSTVQYSNLLYCTVLYCLGGFRCVVQYSTVLDPCVRHSATTPGESQHFAKINLCQDQSTNTLPPPSYHHSTTANLLPPTYHHQPTTTNLPPPTYHKQPTTTNLPPPTYHHPTITKTNTTLHYTPNTTNTNNLATPSGPRGYTESHCMQDKSWEQ